jgi:hypothetical protein
MSALEWLNTLNFCLMALNKLTSLINYDFTTEGLKTSLNCFI